MPVLDSVPSPIMKRVYNMKDQKVQTRPATQPTALVHEAYVRLPAQ
jgi:hypothetical protein